ncbi:hypothetical protein LCGC14_2073940 [marine sediment metagenome]|uniref:Uncharacterized protein n=1 Tax=marine sediment metagenome TaxID=412755 RepID=A0A0F9HEL4_9ZZZZ
MTRLSIRKCNVHGFLSVQIDYKDGCGVRLTPSKCCGRWDLVKSWKLSRAEWQEIITQAEAAMEELLECGHPKDCLVEREITNIEKNEGPLNDTEYCSACEAR